MCSFGVIGDLKRKGEGGRNFASRFLHIDNPTGGQVTRFDSSDLEKVFLNLNNYAAGTGAPRLTL